MTKNEAMIAWLREGATAIKTLHEEYCAGVKCTDRCEERIDAMWAAADEMENDERANRECRERLRTDAAAKVGKYYKERDRSFAFRAGLGSIGESGERMIYRAVTGSDERGQLACWSFTRSETGAMVVDPRDRSGMFGSPGEEITGVEFYEAAAEFMQAIVDLLGGGNG